MRHTAFKFLLALSLLLLLDAQTSVAAKDVWTSVRSQNFHLVGNASEKEIRQAATRLEQFRRVFSTLLQNARMSDSVPTTVVVFKSMSAYKPFNPQGNAGYFQPGEDVNYITLSVETGGHDSPFAVIFHEYLHLLIKNNLSANAPAWISEGLAEFYSTLEVAKDEKSATIGKPISHHVYYLRDQKMLPLRTLLMVDHASPHYNERSKRGVFYAQSWALAHYLMLGKQRQRAPQLTRYLELIGQGRTQQESFEKAFGTDAEAIEKELRDYIRRDTYPVNTYSFTEKLGFDQTMQSEPLSEAQAFTYLGDLALHTQLLDEAERQLQKAHALDANSAMTQSSLGMLRMRQQRFAEAKEHLRRAVSLDARNHLAHYYYAFTLSREGMNEANFISSYAPETAAAMRASLKKSIELKPDFAGSYHLLGFVNLVAGEQIEESIQLLKRAIALAPGEQELYLVLAQLYVRKEDFEGARKLVEPLAQNAPDPQTKASAQSVLDSITRYQEQLAKFKSQREEMEREAARQENGGRAEDPGDASKPVLRRRTDLNNEEAVGMSAEEALALAIREAMRKPQAGETRARGILTRIECNQKGAIFHINTGAQVLKLNGADMSGIQFMAFTQEAGGQIGCGARKPESHVVVTYRPKEKTGGDLVAVEFVPASFQFKQ